MPIDNTSARHRALGAQVEQWRKPVAKQPALHMVEHSWSDTGIYEGDRRIALLSIEDEATEDTQDALEADMRQHALLFTAAPELLCALVDMLNLPAESKQRHAVRAAAEKAVRAACGVPEPK